MPDPPEINQLTLLSSNVLRILTGANHVYHITDAGVDIHACASLTRTGYATMSGITCAALNTAGLWLGTANAGLYRLPLAATSGDVTAQLSVALSTTTTPALASDAINDVDGYGAALLVAHAAGADYLPDSAAATLYRCTVEGGVQKCGCGAEHIALATPYRVGEIPVPTADFAAPGYERALSRLSISDDFHAQGATASSELLPDPTLWIANFPDPSYAAMRIRENAIQCWDSSSYRPPTTLYTGSLRSLYRFSGDFSVELIFKDLAGIQEALGYRKGLGLYIDNNSSNPTGYEILAGSWAGGENPCFWYRRVDSGTYTSYSGGDRFGTSGRIRFTRAGTQCTVDVFDDPTTGWRQLFTHTASSVRAFYVYPMVQIWQSHMPGKITGFRVLSGEPDRLPVLRDTPRALRYGAGDRLVLPESDGLRLVSAPATPVQDGLVAEYSGAGMDITNFTIAPDYGNLQATFTGILSPVAGRLGTAIDFPGNGCIKVPQAALPGGEFTFCCWCKGFGPKAQEYEGASILRCNDLGTYSTITGERDSLFTSISYQNTSNTGAQSLRVALYADRRGGVISYGPFWSSSSSGWNFLAVTYGGGEYNIRTQVWFNGEQISTNTTSRTDFAGATTDILIGSNTETNGTRYFVGQMERIRFYNRALTPVELDALYHEGEEDPPRYPARIAPVANDVCADGESIAWVSGAQYETANFADGTTTITEYGGNVAGLDQQYYHAFADDVWFALPASAIVVWLPVADLTLLAAPLTPPAVTLEMPAALLSFNVPEPVARTYLLHRPHQRIWRLTLDGIELPMSSFQLRLRESDNSYFSAVVPHAPAYADIVAAHSTGQLRIYQGYLYADGVEDLVLIAQATLQTISDSRGPNSQSLTLTGYGKAPAPGPAVETDSVSFAGVSGGVTRWRCAPTPQLAPGGILIDRATGDQIRAALITWYVSISGNSPNAQMEVSTDGNW